MINDLINNNEAYETHLPVQVFKLKKPYYRHIKHLPILSYCTKKKKSNILESNLI